MAEFGYIMVEVKKGGNPVKDARIYVDGTLRVDHVPAKILIRPGSHTVEARKDGVSLANNPRQVKVDKGEPDRPQVVEFSNS